MQNLHINTWLLVITCAVSIIYMENPEVKSRLVFNPYLVQYRRQYWRAWTGGLIHFDYIHLAFNMLALYSFGRLVEAILGSLLYLVLYLTALPFSDLGSFLRYRHQPYYNSLGASGAVSAVVFVAILHYPLANISLYFFFDMPAWIFGLAYMAYSYYASRQSQDAIDHNAHLFGALYGLIFATTIDPDAPSRFFQQILSGSPSL